MDGNTVKSDELFSGNTVTVVNFWFTTCNPCVGELAELDALNKELAEKGGSLIGVNTFTLDGYICRNSSWRRVSSSSSGWKVTPSWLP